MSSVEPSPSGRTPQSAGGDALRVTQTKNAGGLRTKINGLRAARLPWLSAAIIIVILVLPGIFAGWIAPHDPLAGGLSNRLQPPLGFGGTAEHIFGTDRAGRDIFSRMIYGSRVSLTVSGISILTGATIGSLVGMTAGYFGGALDSILMRIVDISLSIPSILIAIVLGISIGPGYDTTLYVVVFVLWALYARQMRMVTLSVATLDYIARARVAGASHLRILLSHILPNVKNTLIVLMTLQVGYVIIFESSLSFLGVGLPRPTPAWGLMVADGRELVVTAWWVSFYPGLAIMLTVLAVNSFGDWLRDRLDPRLRQVQ